MKRFLILFAATAVVLPMGCKRKPPPPQTETPAPKPPLPPPTPESQIQRLTQKPDPEVLQHKIESKTEFPQALASLAPGATPPQVQAPPPQPKAPPATVSPQANSPAPTTVVPPAAEEQKPDPNGPPTKGLTADGITTELVMHDWTGIVLVPLDTVMSRAHTVLISLERVEAHPLQNGQVRVWTRIRNLSDQALFTDVACTFRTVENPDPERPIFYKLNLPASGFRDVFFVSPLAGNLNAYTVLVRADSMISVSGSVP
ncbi:MAG: hypothetical protein KGJ37_00255 [Verrucomicrobiota bacterium]|nr:hypothetical protein [Verrucomicrobiota bacterium]